MKKVPPWLIILASVLIFLAAAAALKFWNMMTKEEPHHRPFDPAVQGSVPPNIGLPSTIGPVHLDVRRNGILTLYYQATEEKGELRNTGCIATVTTRLVGGTYMLHTLAACVTRLDERHKSTIMPGQFFVSRNGKELLPVTIDPGSIVDGDDASAVLVMTADPPSAGQMPFGLEPSDSVPP